MSFSFEKEVKVIVFLAVLLSALWLFDVSGEYAYNNYVTGYVVEAFGLKEGWNFITITPQMVEAGDIDSIKGQCDNIVHAGKAVDNKWVDVTTFSDDDVDKGLFIKVNENCDFNEDAEIVEDATSSFELSAGWNYMGITPDMSGQSVDDISGDCSVELAGVIVDGDWVEIQQIGNDDTYKGLAIFLSCGADAVGDSEQITVANIDAFNFKKGWNFIGITAQMASAGNIDSVKDNCNISRSGTAVNNVWVDVTSFSDADINKGLFIRVNKSCGFNPDATVGNEETGSLTLEPGWHYISITPDLAGKKREDFDGTCAIGLAGIIEDAQWKKVEDLAPEYVYKGLAMRIDNNGVCKFNIDAEEAQAYAEEIDLVVAISAPDRLVKDAGETPITFTVTNLGGMATTKLFGVEITLAKIDNARITPVDTFAMDGISGRESKSHTIQVQGDDLPIQGSDYELIAKVDSLGVIEREANKNNNIARENIIIINNLPDLVVDDTAIINDRTTGQSNKNIQY